MRIKQIIKNNWDEFLHAYYFQECGGCGGHSSFWKTIIESPEWNKWRKYAWEDKMIYDFPECEELGIMSSKHWQDFIKFTLNKKINK
jgi:hypothetical protein